MRKIVFVIAGVVAGSVASTAMAADFAPYARLDLGYGKVLSSGRGNLFAGDTGFNGDKKDQLGESVAVGGGAGVKLPFEMGPLSFRADVTGSYRPDFGGLRSGTLPGGGDTLHTDLKVANTTALANVYADYATGGKVTPFVGLGLGAAWNRVSAMNLVQSDGTQVGSQAGKTETNFAWSLTTGVGIAVLPSVSLDLAYRYLDAGKVKTGSVFSSPSGDAYSAPNHAALLAHELSVSLRYSF